MLFQNSVVLKLFFFISIVVSLLADPKNNTYKPDSQIWLVGRLTIESFYDANQNKEDSFILQVKSPIHVLRDEYANGPLENVRKIQVVFLERSMISKARNKMLGKDIRISGKLFYALTAHHHTGVLLQVSRLDQYVIK